jgi:hypothetical protein
MRSLHMLSSLAWLIMGLNELKKVWLVSQLSSSYSVGYDAYLEVLSQAKQYALAGKAFKEMTVCFLGGNLLVHCWNLIGKKYCSNCGYVQCAVKTLSSREEGARSVRYACCYCNVSRVLKW